MRPQRKIKQVGKQQQLEKREQAHALVGTLKSQIKLTTKQQQNKIVVLRKQLIGPIAKQSGKAAKRLLSATTALKRDCTQLTQCTHCTYVGYLTGRGVPVAS